MLGAVLQEPEGLAGPLIWITPPASAAGMFVYGTVGAFGTVNWMLWIVGWLGMLAGSLVLISFSFILWPVVLMEIPLLWRWTPGRVPVTA
jgi:hypothetical protein